MKVRCTDGAKRIVTRNLYEAEREHLCGLKETPAFKRSAQLRKKVEMRFAHLKRNLNFRRLRLRGLTGAKDEFLLAARKFNLRHYQVSERDNLVANLAQRIAEFARALRQSPAKKP